MRLVSRTLDGLDERLHFDSLKVTNQGFLGSEIHPRLQHIVQGGQCFLDATRARRAAHTFQEQLGALRERGE